MMNVMMTGFYIVCPPSPGFPVQAGNSQGGHSRQLLPHLRMCSPVNADHHADQDHSHHHVDLVLFIMLIMCFSAGNHCHHVHDQ